VNGRQSTRKGKQIMNVSLPDEARLCVPVTGDHVAVIGENRKMLIFPLEQLPEMSRGKGVRLQRYKDGGVSDIRCFVMEGGLTWEDSAGRMHNRKKEELTEWIADRAQAGRLVPKGFPRSGQVQLTGSGSPVHPDPSEARQLERRAHHVEAEDEPGKSSVRRHRACLWQARHSHRATISRLRQSGDSVRNRRTDGSRGRPPRAAAPARAGAPA
jgi:DNA gyrase/topoisomerase IV subunit A